MTITTFAITSTVTIILGLIIYAVIRHFSKEASDLKPIETDEKVSLVDNPIPWFEILKQVEPIQTHVKKMNESSRIIEIFKNAIVKNLSDKGYVVTSSDYFRKVISVSDLPDILELQNIFSLKPIIEDLEDLYKRLDNAKDIEDTEYKWVTGIIISVRDILCNDEEFHRLASAKLIMSYNDQLSPEAKEIVDRAINKVLEEAKES